MLAGSYNTRLCKLVLVFDAALAAPDLPALAATNRRAASHHLPKSPPPPQTRRAAFPAAQLKATSNAFKNNIASVKGGEEMFVLTGWRPVVIDLVKHWAFDGEPGSTKWAVLGEARDVLQRATATIHEKAEVSCGQRMLLEALTAALARALTG